VVADKRVDFYFRKVETGSDSEQSQGDELAAEENPRHAKLAAQERPHKDQALLMNRLSGR
jgi:hypothetical protein